MAIISVLFDFLTSGTIYKVFPIWISAYKLSRSSGHSNCLERMRTLMHWRRFSKITINQRFTFNSVYILTKYNRLFIINV